MRHCEILANNCVPIFTDIELSPNRTLTTLPKKLLAKIKKLRGLNIATSSENPTIFHGHEIIQGESTIDYSVFDNSLYNEYAEKLFDYTKKYLTTKELAKYFITRVVSFHY